MLRNRLQCVLMVHMEEKKTTIEQNERLKIDFTKFTNTL